MSCFVGCHWKYFLCKIILSAEDDEDNTEENSGKVIFVKNLNFETTEESIKNVRSLMSIEGLLFLSVQRILLIIQLLLRVLMSLFENAFTMLVQCFRPFPYFILIYCTYIGYWKVFS